ncbi:MAG: hypothetical protein HYV95_00860 [Opitutae bacterium]|nr:hypothetical protein [Opitutae bacterium]
MSEQRILELEKRVLELEQQLLTANEATAKLTLANTDLTKQTADAETRNKRLRRSARQDENSFRQQLSAAQSRHG